MIKIVCKKCKKELFTIDHEFNQLWEVVKRIGTCPHCLTPLNNKPTKILARLGKKREVLLYPIK